MVLSLQDEIIDDSEPEREERRKLERNAKKLTSPRQAPDFPISREVIEITDDEEADNSVHTRPLNFKSTLNTSAFSRNLSPTLPTRSPSIVITPIIPTPLRAPQASLTVPHAHPLSSPHNEDRGAAPSNYISSDDEPGLNFAQFAYTAPAPKSGLSRAGSSLSTVTTEDKPARKKRLPTTHRFSSDFSDAELAKLTKCVSCEINWTARKSGSQKILHIQSCAKKNVFTDETIRVLIRKEIETAMALGKGKEKATPRLPTEPADPRTFFEDIVTDATRKKKGRRMETTETVQSVTATRSIILDRARTVLGLPDDRWKGTDESSMVHTQSIGRIIPGNGSPMLTQIFGRSALGQTNLKSSNPILPWLTGLSEEEDDSDTEAMPPTQIFAPSKLGGIARVIENEAPLQRSYQTLDAQILTQSDLINRPITSTYPPLIMNGDSTVGSKNLSARGLGLSQALGNDDERLYSSSCRDDNLGDREDIIAVENLDDVDGPPNDFGWDKDGTYLHFEPQVETSIVQTGVEFQTVLFPGEVDTTPRKKKVKTPKRPRPATIEASPSKAAPKRRAPRKARDEQEGQEDNEAWETFMKERLVQDRTLHLRILRYEPIHFDTFLKLASNEASNSGKFKARLRSFLDRQAINFYGADPTGRR